MKKDRFKNKVVIITGSSRGIGKSLAKELCELGASVVINGRNRERLKELEEQMIRQNYEVLAVQGDVTLPSDARELIEATLEKYSRIDILIHMAGVAMNAELEKLDAAVFEQTMKTNYLGAVYTTLAALPHIKASRGNILFISSVTGLIGLPNFSAYCASKMSLTALAESLRLEMTGTGVHIGIIYISFTRNEPGKSILGPRGKKVEKPEFDDEMRYDTRSEVARRIIRQLVKRKFRSNYSLYGKAISFTKSFCPGLLFRLLAYGKKRRLFEGNRQQ